jgi:bifunctional UDP-N-acetylglucosamine pyrophosphorylase/glucosamine-1-phosphate N-acetyltransferase
MPKRHDLAVVILAAGKGKRMKSDLPKVLFDLSGWPLIRHVIDAAKRLKPTRMIAVTGHGRQLVDEALAGTDVETVVQREQKGTGHAIRCAEKALKGFDGTVLVLLGDVPLVRTATLRKLLSTHHRPAGSSATRKGGSPPSGRIATRPPTSGPSGRSTRA